ncbi:TonB-dependent receptor [Duganella sp. Leaf126]|uniref:TonB-dependent receptor n=1 Tax=Duganella sp. Leaf126 TaxID=1736266 RepID=UPI000A447B2C|nr:TonB-dependent receptor [Duganella sp. Leaf126]
MSSAYAHFRLTSMAIAVLGTFTLPATAGAAADGPQAADAPEQQVVVTGTSGRKKKFDTPYAISTIADDDIGRKEPRSAVDLLKSVPGVKVENSGGQGGGENVVIRGLPFAGFRLMDMLEDGLPLFESNYERQLQIDELYRLDLGTQGAEIVRGGTAPIYSNNAAGGVVNFLSNFGTEESRHVVKLSAGQHREKRVDLASSGPVAQNDDRLLYSVSGFYRQGDGLRDPGYAHADRGGQLRLGATYRLDDGRGKLFAGLKIVNDRNIFYSSIPLTDARNGNSLASLIDPHTGTLASASFRHVRFPVLDGQGGIEQVSRDLADGIHPDIVSLTLGAELNLAGGWKLSDKARYLRGDVGFDALLNGAPVDAGAMLQNNLAAARKAFPGTTQLRYLVAATGQPFDPAATAGLTMANTWSSTRSHLSNAINDLRLSNTLAGAHDVTVGVSLSRYSLAQQQIGNTLITSVRNNPDALDIEALDASGQPTGMVTENGFSTYGSGDLIGQVHGLASALYAAENWHIDPAWQADVGIRHEARQETGLRGVIGKQVLASSGPLAAQSVTGLTGYAPYSHTLKGTAWTAGTLYRLARPLNLFARYSSAYSLPRLSDYWSNINNGVAGTLPNGQPVPVVPVRQAELGARLYTPTLQLALIGFYSHFSKLNTSTYFANGDGVLSNQPLLINTSTRGIELEGTWRPASAFELGGSLTWQRPAVDGGETFNTVAAGSIVGKQIPRVPKTMATLNPAYLFSHAGQRGRLYASFGAVGRSYQDFVNTSVLRAYRTVDVGVQYPLSEHVTVQCVVNNVTNAAGLSEGNARAPEGNLLTVADATTGRPLFGRNFTASATFQW